MPRDKQMLESAMLTVRWQRGDRTAFDGIVRLWERPLFYYLRRLASSEADAWELLQETWLKVFRSLASLRDPHAMPAFLYRTARNTAMSRLRCPEFYITGRSEDEQIADNSTDPISNFDNVEAVHHALAKLPLLQREALTLYFLQDLTMEELAVLLGVPIGTVKSRLHGAKKTLKKVLIQGASHD